MRDSDLDYEAWVESISPSITDDALWRVEAYRLALFLADLSWQDVTKLATDKRTVALSDQMYRALGSISANIAEGFSRGSHRDRVRFYEYALGSARESRDWYHKARHILSDDVVEHRFSVLAQIIRLLLRMVSDQRGYAVREEPAPYGVDADWSQ